MNTAEIIYSNAEVKSNVLCYNYKNVNLKRTCRSFFSRVIHFISVFVLTFMVGAPISAQLFQGISYSAGLNVTGERANMRWHYDGQLNNIDVHPQEKIVGLSVPLSASINFNDLRAVRIDAEFGKCVFEGRRSHDGFMRSSTIGFGSMIEGKQPLDIETFVHIAAGLGYYRMSFNDLNPYYAAYETPYLVGATWHGGALKTEISISNEPKNRTYGIMLTGGIQYRVLDLVSYSIGDFSDWPDSATSQIRSWAFQIRLSVLFGKLSKPQNSLR